MVGAYDDAQGRGAAFVFGRDAGSWSSQQKLVPSSEEYSEFGRALAISGDTLVVGAPRVSSDTGAAYVFVRDGAGWREQAKLVPGDHPRIGWFGWSVAVSGDVAVVGAPAIWSPPSESRGAAYVFVREGHRWIERQKLVPPDGSDTDTFGVNVAIHGEVVAVGAMFNDAAPGVNQVAAHLFALEGSEYTEQYRLIPSGRAQASIAGSWLALDEQTLVLGAAAGEASPPDNHGAVYVFSHEYGGWYEEAKLVPSTSATGDEFGMSVALHGDTLLIGATATGFGSTASSGAAYLFQRTVGGWSEQHTLALTAADFGASVALTGTDAVIGATGAAYAYSPKPERRQCRH